MGGKRIANYLLVFFSAVSLTLLCLPMSPLVQSFKAGLSYLFNPIPFHGSRAAERFSRIPSSIRHLILADIENRELREELKNAALLKAEAESLRRENERLRGELGIKPGQGRLLLWARVVKRESPNWFRFLLVDAGEKDGLELNAPVLGLKGGTLGAVGRITEIGPRWSKVLLLTDELSSAAAYIPSKQWEGLIEGQGNPKLRMNYLPEEAQFTIGEAVYTSPTSETFPPDILVGHISRVFASDPFLAFQSVEVTPAVQASVLKEVMILVRQRSK